MTKQTDFLRTDRIQRLLPAGILILLLLALAGCTLFQPEQADTTPAIPTRVSQATVPPVTTIPSVTITPSSGERGTLIHVAGSGWQPGERLNICLDDLGQNGPLPVRAVVEANADGTFTAAFTFPTDVQWQSLPIVPIVVESQARPVKASATFTVLEKATAATPTLAPTATRAATSTPAGTTPLPTNTPRPTHTATPTNTPRPATATPSPTPNPVMAYWRGEYFNNTALVGEPVLVRDDAVLDFDWGTGAPIGIHADGFSVRWTRTLNFDAGTYRFYAFGDDGVRVWLDDWLIIDQWHDATDTTYQQELQLSGGIHTVTVAYYENRGAAQVQVWWDRPGSFPDWRGEYWANRTLTGQPTLVRNDTSIGFNWGAGAPAGNLPTDDFSARWTRTLHFDEGNYTFQARVDDGVRIYVDDVLVVDEWRDGNQRDLSGSRWLPAGNHTVRVEYYEHRNNAIIQVWWDKIVGYPDWKGEYWANPTLSGFPALVRNDGKIDFDWGLAAPSPALPADSFSARWTRPINFGSGIYRFYAVVDDGVRVFVDNQAVIDQWHDSSGDRTYQGDITLNGGTHSLRVEYYDHLFGGRVKVWWEKVEATATPTPTNTPQPTATSTPQPTNTPRPTATPTNTPVPPTATPTATPEPAPQTDVWLNEILPAPSAIDWDGNGTADATDEWIELRNLTAQPVDLGGWSLVAGSSSAPYLIPAGTVIPANGYLIFYRAETGLVLNDQMERLLLLAPDHNVVDSAGFGPLGPDASYSRDASGSWHVNWPPSPGRANTPVGPEIEP